METRSLDVLEDFRILISVLQRQNPNLTARALQEATKRALVSEGFSVLKEVSAPYIGQRNVKRTGRIDLFIERGNLKVAVELDRGAPRRKSILKLRAMPQTVMRVIVIREPRMI